QERERVWLQRTGQWRRGYFCSRPVPSGTKSTRRRRARQLRARGGPRRAMGRPACAGGAGGRGGGWGGVGVWGGVGGAAQRGVRRPQASDVNDVRNGALTASRYLPSFWGAVLLRTTYKFLGPQYYIQFHPALTMHLLRGFYKEPFAQSAPLPIGVVLWKRAT